MRVKIGRIFGDGPFELLNGSPVIAVFRKVESLSIEIGSMFWYAEIGLINDGRFVASLQFVDKADRHRIRLAPGTACLDDLDLLRRRFKIPLAVDRQRIAASSQSAKNKLSPVIRR